MAQTVRVSGLFMEEPPTPLDPYGGRGGPVHIDHAVAEAGLGVARGHVRARLAARRRGKEEVGVAQVGAVGHPLVGEAVHRVAVRPQRVGRGLDVAHLDRLVIAVGEHAGQGHGGGAAGDGGRAGAGDGPFRAVRADDAHGEGAARRGRGGVQVLVEVHGQGRPLHPRPEEAGRRRVGGNHVVGPGTISGQIRRAPGPPPHFDVIRDARLQARNRVAPRGGGDASDATELAARS